MLEYLDASDSPDERIDYPEYVRGFEQLGFDIIGRIIAVPTEGTNEELASGFGDRASEFLEHMTIPTPVLRAPDRSAFVEVSWFWESPSIRIRTTLDDGSLVETLRRWEVPPPTGPMSGYWRTADIDVTMTRQNNPAGGRSVEVIAECDPAEQWKHHRDHVARYAAQRNARPIDHWDLEGSIAQLRSTFEHSLAVERGYVRTWKPLVLGYAGIGFAAITVLVAWSFILSAKGGNGRPFFVGAIGVALFFAFTMVPVVKLVISRVRSSPKWLRPDFVDSPEQRE